ncbi:c-type cytochrome [Sulfitobacter sp. F26169L]|uniref:c-type cytochrome n=1 Tax=Sulfitobacter sp. F26169L TaxID=2996015 RepID=UPI002260C629|nr:c-type cytochrome [Sulfitobacter sp. F26169L]MCX7564843.1 c-type cytochrome [Sulfitobacter sp. F26169L]
MKLVLAAATTLFLAPVMGSAQDVENGTALYDQHCAVCHGADARGKGPLAPALIVQPPSLTELTKRNDVFPTVRVVQRIDGSDPLVAHGSPMPIYGPFFEEKDAVIKSESGQPIMTSIPIADLVAYLKHVQE